METLQINKSNALKAYNQADGSLKRTLSTLFGIEVLSQDPIDRFKTYEEICESAGIHPWQSLPYPTPITKKEVSLNGVFKLETIYEEFNRQIPDTSNDFKEYWEPDYTNGSQRKWYPWMDWSPSLSRFVFTNTRCTHTGTCLGARLCTNTDAKAKYIGIQFEKEFNEFLNPQI